MPDGHSSRPRNGGRVVGIVNLLKIVPGRLSLAEICECGSGENTGVRESTKPYIVLSLLHIRAIFGIKLTALIAVSATPAKNLNPCMPLTAGAAVLLRRTEVTGGGRRHDRDQVDNAGKFVFYRHLSRKKVRLNRCSAIWGNQARRRPSWT